MTDRVYTKFGLRLVNHDASKIKSDGGLIATTWAGSITFETTVEVDNEVELTRDLETLLRHKIIPVHGRDPILRGTNFHWDTRQVDNGTFQDYVRVTVNYMSSIRRLQNDEMLTRLKEMGYEKIEEIESNE